MLSLGVLSMFNMLVLLSPPSIMAELLTLMALPFEARTLLLFAVALNVVISLGFEQWGAQTVAVLIGNMMRRHGRRRVRNGKTYKSVEGGMREV